MNVSRLAAAPALVFLAACAGNTAPPASQSNAAGQAPAYRPHYALTLPLARQVKPDLAYVTYHGGPVLLHPKVYLIFWAYKTYGDPSGMQKLLTAYTKVMGGSTHNAIVTQYYDVVKSQTTYIANPFVQFAGSWNDNSAIPTHPSDAQIAQEAVKGVEHFGGYNPNAMYLVATAHNHSDAGFGTSWCSYHSDATYKSNPIPYINLPYITDAGTDCGANAITPPSDESGEDEGITIFGGHEYAEMITDPVPYSGWNGVSGEIGDYCQGYNFMNDPFGSASYTMQPLLSNMSSSCVQAFQSP